MVWDEEEGGRDKARGRRKRKRRRRRRRRKEGDSKVLLFSVVKKMQLMASVFPN